MDRKRDEVRRARSRTKSEQEEEEKEEEEVEGSEEELFLPHGFCRIVRKVRLMCLIEGQEVRMMCLIEGQVPAQAKPAKP